MKTLADQVREAAQLCRNVEEAAERVQVLELEVFAQEVADWARSITTLLSETAMELARQEAGYERTKTEPLGFEPMAEVVEEQRR